MKRMILLLSVVALGLGACTKDTADDNSALAGQFEDNPNGGGGNNINASALPAAVTSAFTARYPDASRIEWKKLSDGTYKAEFFRGSVRWQVIFTAAGTIVKEERA